MRDRETVCSLLSAIRVLPTNTKFDELTNVILDLKRDGYGQVMVFTQFTDTMDFLRERLKDTYNIVCYSGRHGEEPLPDGRWRQISRDDAKKRFSEGSVDVLLCTDAAAEGLNFQFCGAMINYDMPWNPMKVEQRIGRIDRIGQEHETIRIINMYYKGTVEADVYLALRRRINLFEEMIGTLQPILSELDRIIIEGLLTGGDVVMHGINEDVDGAEENAAFDLDSMLEADYAEYEPPESPVTMDDLDRMVNNHVIMWRYNPKHGDADRQYVVSMSDGRPVRITTDRNQFENYSDSMEFWSPGSPAFPNLMWDPKPTQYKTLKELLDTLKKT